MDITNMGGVGDSTGTAKKRKRVLKGVKNLLDRSVPHVLTEVQLLDEITAFRCDKGTKKCSQDPGGCFRRNFVSNDGSILFGNMCKVLLLHREKTRVLSKEDKNTFGIKIFAKHCLNVSDVISPTEDISNFLFGDGSICGECSPSRSSQQPPLTNKKGKFGMNWDVQVDGGLLPDNRVHLNLCRRSLAFLYGLKENQFKAIPQKMKTANSSGSSLDFT
jgi:hypothetical protein